MSKPESIKKEHKRQSCLDSLSKRAILAHLDILGSLRLYYLFNLVCMLLNVLIPFAYNSFGVFVSVARFRMCASGCRTMVCGHLRKSVSLEVDGPFGRKIFSFVTETWDCTSPVDFFTGI